MNRGTCKTCGKKRRTEFKVDNNTLETRFCVDCGQPTPQEPEQKCCDECKIHFSCGIDAALEDGFGKCTCEGNGCDNKNCPCHSPKEAPKEFWKNFDIDKFLEDCKTAGEILKRKDVEQKEVKEECCRINGMHHGIDLDDCICKCHKKNRQDTPEEEVKETLYDYEKKNNLCGEPVESSNLMVNKICGNKKPCSKGCHMAQKYVRCEFLDKKK